MSSPFEKSPQLREYLKWARSKGFTDATGHNGTTGFIILTCPNGHKVPIADIPLSEILSHSMISWLNRRTGIISPFPSTPEPYC